MATYTYSHSGTTDVDYVRYLIRDVGVSDVSGTVTIDGTNASLSDEEITRVVNLRPSGESDKVKRFNSAADCLSDILRKYALASKGKSEKTVKHLRIKWGIGGDVDTVGFLKAQIRALRLRARNEALPNRRMFRALSDE